MEKTHFFFRFLNTPIRKIVEFLRVEANTATAAVSLDERISLSSIIADLVIIFLNID